MGKTPDQIRTEILLARNGLVDSVRGLSSEVHPSVIKQQAVAQVKGIVTSRVDAAKAFFVDDAGVRWDHIGTVALVVAGTLLVHGSLHRVLRLLLHR